MQAVERRPERRSAPSDSGNRRTSPGADLHTLRIRNPLPYFLYAQAGSWYYLGAVLNAGLALNWALRNCFDLTVFRRRMNWPASHLLAAGFIFSALYQR